MKIECVNGCAESKGATCPMFNVETTVTIYEDLTLLNKSMDGVDLEDVLCAYCNGPVWEVKEDE